MAQADGKPPACFFVAGRVPLFYNMYHLLTVLKHFRKKILIFANSNTET